MDDRAVERLFAGRLPFYRLKVTAASTTTESVATLPLKAATTVMEGKLRGAYRVARAARITDSGSLSYRFDCER